MHNHWGHFLAVAAAILAAAALLVSLHWSHQRTAGQLYAAAITAHWPPDLGATTLAPNTYFATEDQQEKLTTAVRQGVRSAQTLNFEANVWSGLFIALLLLLLFYHMWASKRFM
jgi:hypothetical protein